MDWVEALLGFWEMYHSNPLFWIILVPFILWWWNFLRKQLEGSGLVRAMSSFRYYIANKLNHRKEYRSTVTPSPKSGSPFKLWREILFFPLITITPLLILFAISAAETRLSLQWWSVIGGSIVFVIGFGMPVHISILTLWVKINKNVKKAIQKLKKLNTSDNGQGDNYLDIFLIIADDLRMGLDPRLLHIIAVQLYQVDSLSFLNELMSLSLIKPDRKTKYDTLAHRYYLTRSGATLVDKMKKKEKE